tara:strand:- start:885 stop:1193 length:309 start_codon:yes stop_codon:yes gene_type:complete
MAEFIRHRTDDPDLTKVQDQIETYSVSLRSEILPAGRLIKGLKLSTTRERVAHGLGRSFSGYIVVSKNSHATVIIDTEDNSSPGRYIPLLASADVEVSLWVF